MAQNLNPVLWIAGGLALLLIGCCRGRGTKCLYDRPCSGRVGVSWTPDEDWSYGVVVEPKGPYKVNTKAFAISDGANDRFVLYGDGRGVVHNSWEFIAPIKVKEIYTESGTKWPDYVFEPSYRLRSLQELETFVRQNKHLPGLPSHQLIARQGLPLISTQKALVEKVEELTLYVIALQKQVDSLKARLNTRPPCP